MNNPIIIDGTHAIKNLFNSLNEAKFKSLLEDLIIIKFIKLVSIDKGSKKKKISMMVYPSINKNGVPNTNTPTPTED